MDVRERALRLVFEQRSRSPPGVAWTLARRCVQAARLGRRTRTVAEPRDELTSARNVVCGSPKRVPPATFLSTPAGGLSDSGTRRPGLFYPCAARSLSNSTEPAPRGSASSATRTPRVHCTPPQLKNLKPSRHLPRGLLTFGAVCRTIGLTTRTAQRRLPPPRPKTQVSRSLATRCLLFSSRLQTLTVSGRKRAQKVTSGALDSDGLR